ncbi:MAG: phosphoribosylformylglycinamidine cyclo-ligase [Lentisphaerae bacterium]|nr:phosphoribosylformylglycinamidine cyclo-ligase [Lentisphaerota bacterium]
MNQVLRAVKQRVRNTFTAGVRGDIGAFGGLFDAPGRDSLLVASTDGVGTKLKVAALAGRHDTVGRDLVNHCVNDILVQGARPLFFLDYLGTARLEGPVFRDIVTGLCRACRANGCALLGGETAEMPGLYPRGEYDLVGTIVGTVRRRDLVTGASIRPGDVILGLPSSGLHTNGYSLARRVVFDQAGLDVSDRFPGTRRRVADVLLAVHRSYLKPVAPLLGDRAVRGMAHITGGGFPDNIARILPGGTAAVIDRSAWRVPPVFRFIRDRGRIAADEMYRVFNMGIGFVLVVRPADATRVRRRVPSARLIGRITAGSGGVTLH